jgi:malonyl-CoA O-methyltransferase
MLRSAPQAVLCAAADARMLPFANSSFDVVWCRLVLGHLREAGAAYGELARVCSPGGIVVVSDLHPAAIAAGHRRTFRDRDGIAHELEHVVHGIDGHRAAASRAGLVFDVERVGVIGPSIEHFYIDAARRDAYVAQRGLPLISVLAWHKRAGAA